jgi:hypothetical protein
VVRGLLGHDDAMTPTAPRCSILARGALAASLAASLLGAGCSIEAPAPDDEGSADLTEALAKTGGYQGTFNRPGQGHAVVCVKLKNGSAELRYPDFTPTGYTLKTSDLDYPSGGECPDGTARLDAREIIDTPNGRLYFHRGGYGYVGGGDVKYGHLWIADLAKHVDTTPSPAGNGKPCAAAKSGPNEGHYEIRPRALEPDMHYCKTNSSCDTPATTNGYSSYGDPAQQGSHADPNIHYTYLDWSWINVAGGGVVRAILPDGAVFHRCDVPAIKLATVTEHGKVNGWVKAIYGKTRQGSEWIYGWVVHSHRYEEGPVVYHVEKRPDLY